MWLCVCGQESAKGALESSFTELNLMVRKWYYYCDSSIHYPGHVGSLLFHGSLSHFRGVRMTHYRLAECLCLLLRQYNHRLIQGLKLFNIQELTENSHC